MGLPFVFINVSREVSVDFAEVAVFQTLFLKAMTAFLESAFLAFESAAVFAERRRNIGGCRIESPGFVIYVLVLVLIQRLNRL